MAVDYQKMKDAYYGTGGYENGSYLKKHPRESETKYENRKEVSYYLNYVAPTVDGHINPIFREPATRDWKGSVSDLWQLFSEDADCAGTSISDFMKMASLPAKLYGVSFIVVDNFEVKNQPTNKEDVIIQRIMPYAYVITPDKVKKYEIDRMGRLLSITFSEDPDEDINTEEELVYRTLTATEWKVTDEGGETIHKQGTHNLGIVPVVPLLSRKQKLDKELPSSEFNAIIRTNNNIFQLCSWLTEILQNQTFPVLTYPSKEATDLTIGSENAIGFDGKDSKHAPAFISPPSEPAIALSNRVDALIKEIYRMAQLSHVTGVEVKSSGIAKSWDFNTSNMALAVFASNVEAAEIRVAFLFAKWLNSDLEYSCKYAQDFAVPDVGEELANAQLAIDLNLGAQFNAEVARKVIEAYLPGLETDTYDLIIKSILAAVEDAEQAKKADAQDLGNE